MTTDFLAEKIERSRKKLFFDLFRSFRLFSCRLSHRLLSKQQTPSSHVLEPAGGIAPTPSHTEFTGKRCPIRLGMSLQPIAKQSDLLREQCPPRNDQLSIHWPTNSRRRKVNSEKNQSTRSEGPCRRETSTRTLHRVAVGRVKMRIPGRNLRALAGCYPYLRGLRNRGTPGGIFGTSADCCRL